MNRTRVIFFASVIAAAMVFGGVVGATVLARTTLTPALAAASPSPAGHSNESATHEQGETAAQEAAENNGTARPGGPAAHEKAETAAQEAAENAACPSPAASTTATN